MLIRIKGKILNNEIQFQIPPIFFDNKSFVSLQQMIIQFNTNQVNISGSLSTSLIDRSPINPDQVLADFQLIPTTKTLFYQPTHSHYYKIQRMDLTTSEFNLSFREKIENKEIKQIEILLHVIDARIQPRFEQSIY